MINFNYENEFNLENEDAIASWLSASILSEGKKEGEINYIFVMTNIYTINLEYLKHDDLTDIISFDYTLGNEIHGDILFLWNVFRKRGGFQSAFEEEIRRVMVHGVCIMIQGQGEAESY
jgi:ssRNA-specific RNase YbeY (16S rRNA maturation enzyme)